MKNFKLAITGALIALTQLHCQSIQPQSAQRSVLNVESYTADDTGFDVNSYLITGNRDAILVDAQFTRTDAKKVAEMVRRSGKNLKTIFITHGHPDHFLGLEILTSEFPDAQVLATPEVIADIKRDAPGKLAYWKPLYKDNLADRFVIPAALVSNELELEGTIINVIKLGPGESENAAALFIPSTGVLFTGDNSYNDVHLWLAENRPQEWLKNLKSFERLEGVKTVLPGHGPSSDRGLFARNESYIGTFMKVTSGRLNKDQAVQALTSRYPEFRLPVIASLSVGARLKK